MIRTRVCSAGSSDRLTRVRHSPFDTIAAATVRGFQLEERLCAGEWAWGWHPDDDWRYPCFLTEREAVGWMDDWLDRIAVFER